MRDVTLQTLLTKIEADADGKRGCGFMILIFIAAIVLMAGASIFSIYGVVFVLAFGIPALILLIKGRKRRKKLKSRAFYIVTDTCTRKHTRNAGEEGDAYILTFSNGLEHTLSIEDAGFASQERNQNDDWLYDQTAVGDQFYLVYLDGDAKPIFVFPHKLCQLDTAEFEETAGKLRPKKV